MSKLKLNLCVVNLNDGGELLLEKYENMDKDFINIFDYNLKNKEVGEVNLNEGLIELDEYFNNYGERDEIDKNNYIKIKSEFINKIGSKVGNYYLWGVEYDLELMFIEN